VVDFAKFSPDWVVVGEMWWPETAEGGRKWTQLWLELFHPHENLWAGFKLLE
jgi:hypothetical protein